MKRAIEMAQGAKIPRYTENITIFRLDILFIFFEDECLKRPTQCLNVYTVLAFYEMRDEYSITICLFGPTSLYCYSLVEKA